MAFKKYKNLRGSILELALLPDQKMEGYFTTAVASPECQDIVGKPQAIVGGWTGNVLTFSVVYPSCGSVYTAVGNFDKDQQSIDVLGLVNHQADDVAGKDCTARRIGHDVYHLI
jgi:hypothetical protein